MESELQKKIKEENVTVHAKEALFYEDVHSEIFNKYEQNRVKKDIDRICSLLSSGGKSVLDVGCGTGNLSLKFRERNFDVTGIDISKEMLDVLRSKTDLVTIINADIDTYIKNKDANEQYDIICFSSVLHHLPDYEDSLMQVCRFLKVGGVLYIVHEPTLRRSATSSIKYKILDNLEFKFYALNMAIKNIHPPPIDYTYSDYHAQRGGIDLIRISNILSDLGMHTFDSNLYWARKFSIFALIDNKVIRSPTNCCFKIIARKEQKGEI